MTRQGRPWPSGVTMVQILALCAPCAVVVAGDLVTRLPILIAAVIAALGLEALFAVLRRRDPGVDGLTTALIFATLCPAETAIWQVAVCVSLGVVLGELVFGGRGFGFLHPATVGLALLVLSFPQLGFAPPSQALALATLPGAAMLLALGLISGRVLLAAVATAAGLYALGGPVTAPLALATGLAFGLVFLIADPVAAASTTTGRWVYGALAGGLVAVFSPPGEITSQAVVFAALMAGIFAPLIDRLVVIAHVARWRRRHGD